MNNVYATLLSSIDYVMPIIILNQNLKDLESKYPLYVMVTEDIYDDVIEVLQKEEINTVKVPVIEYPEMTRKDMPERLLAIASKLNVFTLKQFYKVAYLDADSIFFQNIDDIFDYPDGSLYDDGGERGFCGLFVCCPWAHPFEYYKTLLENLPIWESDVIEELWFHYRTDQRYHINTKYFLSFTTEDLDYMIPNIVGVHFCSEYKPWNYKNKYEFWADFRKQFDTSGSIKDDIIRCYFERYLIPFRQKYPNLQEEIK